MATKGIKVNVVDVGQGQCTFVEIYDMADKLSHTLLFDCGSDHRSDETAKNLKYIAAKVNAMATPAFDLLSFSHSDNDHVSLMREVIANCLPTKPKVKKLVYGGDRNRFTKRGYNIINTLVKDGYCTEDEIGTPSPDSSGFDRDEKKYGDPLWKSDDGEVKVYLMVGNVVSDEPEELDPDDLPDELPVLKGAEALNRVSLVCQIHFNGCNYIICGDATNRTMGGVNFYFQGMRVPYTPMVTLPHHGSRSTGLNVTKDRTANDEAIAVVRTFARICNGRTISISSFAKHGHPSVELATYFTRSLLAKPQVQDVRSKDGSHSMVSYIDMNLSFPDTTIVPWYAYTSYATAASLYGTNYFNSATPMRFVFGYAGSAVNPAVNWEATPVNAHASWVYSADSIKNESILGVTNLQDATVFTKSVAGSATDHALRRPLPAPAPALSPLGGRPARLRSFR